MNIWHLRSPHRIPAAQDFEVIRPILPKLKSSPEKPAYVPSATHMLPTFSSFNLTPGAVWPKNIFEWENQWKNHGF
jgi:hypothetical protein